VAVARRQWLYCGADHSGLVPPAARGDRDAPIPARPARDAPPTDRVLLIVAADGVEVARLADALGLSPYEAGQWARRGGYRLHRMAAPAEAEAERARLAALGVAVYACREADVRSDAEPDPVIGGGFDGLSLRLRTPAGGRAVGPADLLLVVRGPIAREHPVQETLRFARVATLEPGFRFHLHLQGGGRPLELDPAAFEFGAERANEGSFLEISGWIAAVAAGVPVDDAFRRVTPALAPVLPVEGAAATAADALRTTALPAPAILDNLAQFRFYSAWRGAVERQARRR
jgi:hypothetical protein